MSNTVSTFVQSLLLVLAISLDAFFASIAYGNNKIKIPTQSILIINTICTGFLTFSLLLGSIAKIIIPKPVTSLLGFIFLLFLGIYYLFQSLVKNYLLSNSVMDKRINIKLADLRFIIDIYLDETKADIDQSKNLSPHESIFLAVALSLDSLTVGFSSSLASVHYLQVIFLSLISNQLAIWFGLLLGNKFAKRAKIDLAWLSGLLLIVLALMQLSKV
jgi:putative sporulation protein YtaF